MVTPAAHREAVAHLRSVHEMSERRACRVLGVDRASVRYQATRPDDGALRDRLKALAQERRRFGYLFKIHPRNLEALFPPPEVHRLA